jgi:plastocyanin
MKKLLIVLVIAAVAVGAYLVLKPKMSGEPSASPTPSTGGTPAATVSRSPVTSPGAGANPSPKTYQVFIESSTYSTASLTVKRGDKVMFSNRASQPQDVIADNGAFSSGDISGGGNWTLDTTNLAAGTYAYHSSKQPNMEAILIVQ